MTLRRILLINPNTAAAATERMLARGRTALAGRAGVVVDGVTAPFGAETIATAAETTIAAHAVLVAAARAAAGADAVIVAAFVDPGLPALRELLLQPCIGLCEAAMLAAAAGGRRFGIVTPGSHLDPVLRTLAAAYGVAAQLAGIEYLAAPIAEVARDPDRHLADFAAAAARLAARGATAVAIGGGPLAGVADRLAPPAGVVLIDGIEAAVHRALALIEVPPDPLPARVPGRYRGLDPDLLRLLAGAVEPPGGTR